MLFDKWFQLDMSSVFLLIIAYVTQQENEEGAKPFGGRKHPEAECSLNDEKKLLGNVFHGVSRSSSIMCNLLVNLRRYHLPYIYSDLLYLI